MFPLTTHNPVSCMTKTLPMVAIRWSGIATMSLIAGAGEA